MPEWRLFICSDCDTDEGAVIVQVPEGSNRERSSGFDFCPGCGHYLSLSPWGKVEVTGNNLVGLAPSLREAADS